MHIKNTGYAAAKGVMSIKNMSIKLGLFAGRHEMPVNGYIFSSDMNIEFTEEGFEVLNSVAYYVLEIYQNSFRGCNIHVDLYVTGLSAALAAVIKACNDLELSLTLWHYNKDNNTYVPQEIWTD